jgi:hypothetical protein
LADKASTRQILGTHDDLDTAELVRNLRTRQIEDDETHRQASLGESTGNEHDLSLGAARPWFTCTVRDKRGHPRHVERNVKTRSIRQRQASTRDRIRTLIALLLMIARPTKTAAE